MTTQSAPANETLFTTGQLAKLLDAELIGSPDIALAGLETLERATRESLSFVRNAKFLGMWRDTECGAAMLTRSVLDEAGDIDVAEGRALLIVDNADRALVRMLHELRPPALILSGIDSSASIEPSASIEDGVAIGPHAVIGPEVSIGAGAQIHAGCVIGAGVRIGAQTDLQPNVVVHPRCVIGDRCTIHPGASIGADGFGFLPSPDGRGVIKIPHIGNVVIGDDVEIGANTCIDRAKFGSTLIGDGTKIDNLVQIGHGCRIGRACLICGVCGLAGSVVLEDGVTVAGCAGIADGLTVGTGATIAAKSGVMKNVGPGETWFGYPARPAISILRQLGTLEKITEILPEVRRIMKDQPGSR